MVGLFPAAACTVVLDFLPPCALTFFVRIAELTVSSFL